MSRDPHPGLPSLAGLLGTTRDAARERLGPPDVERRVGGDRWLVWDREGATLRVRCRAAEPVEGRREEEGERVASWSVSFARGRPGLREAAGPLGLWPACAPDVRAEDAGPLIRRPLPHPDAGVHHSLTATVRDGAIRTLAGFDEPPEWLSGSEATGTPPGPPAGVESSGPGAVPPASRGKADR